MGEGLRRTRAAAKASRKGRCPVCGVRSAITRELTGETSPDA